MSIQSKLVETVGQAIGDFDSIKTAIESKGVAVPSDTATSGYADKIKSITSGTASLDSYYGDKSNGEDVTISANTNFTSTMDGTWIRRQYGNLTINSGVTVSTSNPCCGLVILCDGTLTINGTLSMSKKASKIQFGDIPPIHKDLIPVPVPTGGSGGNSTFARPWLGGLGAGGGFQRGGSPFYASARSSGGYYAQIHIKTPKHASYQLSSIMESVGTAGGVGHMVPTYSSGDDWYGSLSTGYGAGGGGVFKWEKADHSSVGEYSGGCVIIVARKVIIGSTGKIECNGGNGGPGILSGTYTASTSWAEGGAGGGGGVVYLCTQEYQNTGTIQVNGGSAGASLNTSNLSAGYVGTILINQLAV